MSLALTQSLSAISKCLTASFLATGGTPAFVYSVNPGGAGGTIDASTGLYTAPANYMLGKNSDIVTVTDSTTATATAKIRIGGPIILFMDIIQKRMSLQDDQIWLFDQKEFIPTDDRLYVTVAVPNSKQYSNNVKPAGSPVGQGGPGWDTAMQYANFCDTMAIEIMSRSTEALFRHKEVPLALQSVYSEQQQETNSFRIYGVPSDGNILNLSEVDGSAIPYRYRLMVKMSYAVSLTNSVDYFDTFDTVEVTTEP